MKAEEYIKTVVFNNRMINIGLDDYGQSYFIEYLDDEGNLKEESCYGYCSYEIYLEDRFGGCENCDKCLRKYIGSKFIGLVCGKDYSDIPTWKVVSPCLKEKWGLKKENNNE